MDMWFPRLLLAVLVATAVSPTIGGFLLRASFAVPLCWCGVLTTDQVNAFAFMGMVQ